MYEVNPAALKQNVKFEWPKFERLCASTDRSLNSPFKIILIDSVISGVIKM